MCNWGQLPIRTKKSPCSSWTAGILSCVWRNLSFTAPGCHNNPTRNFPKRTCENQWLRFRLLFKASGCLIKANVLAKGIHFLLQKKGVTSHRPLKLGSLNPRQVCSGTKLKTSRNLFFRWESKSNPCRQKNTKSFR